MVTPCPLFPFLLLGNFTYAFVSIGENQTKHSYNFIHPLKKPSVQWRSSFRSSHSPRLHPGYITWKHWSQPTLHHGYTFSPLITLVISRTRSAELLEVLAEGHMLTFRKPLSTSSGLYPLCWGKPSKRGCLLLPRGFWFPILPVPSLILPSVSLLACILPHLSLPFL